MWSCLCWQRKWKAYPHGKMFTVLTRVVEKTAAYLCVLMEFIMDSLKKDGDLDGCEIIRQWSDCGPHYRAVRTLTHVGAYWPAKYHKSFHMIWGLMST